MMMTLDRRFIRDLGKIFTVLNERFFLEELQITVEEKTINYGGDREYVDSYVIEFRYRNRDIRLETYGDGLVHTHVEGKFERIFDFDTDNEDENRSNIRMFADYTQTDRTDI